MGVSPLSTSAGERKSMSLQQSAAERTPTPRGGEDHVSGPSANLSQHLWQDATLLN